LKRFEEERNVGNVLFKRTDTSPLITSTRTQSKWNIYTKIWLNGRLEEGSLPLDMFDKFENRHSSQELSELGIPFDFAKPTDLIAYLAKICGTAGNDIILDFFAGSGSTAHAVLNLNKQDGASRKFILVQLPEPTDLEGFPTVADIAEERVRRVVARLDAADDKQLAFSASEPTGRGFRVFGLAQSNVKEWDADIRHDVGALEKQLALSVDHLREDRTDMDILYEVVLKSGYPLCVTIDEETIEGRKVYSVSQGAFLICLERNLTLNLIRAIGDRHPERVLFLDEGFAGNDQLKTNAAQTFKHAFRTL
jgi:adenine-specific DNA-methyltransferase